MAKIDIKNISKDELIKELVRMDEKPYRAAQIFRWLYKACPVPERSERYRASVKSFDEMTDLNKELREKLKDKFHITKIVLLDSKRSFSDGATKYLLKLEDSHTIESVFLPEEERSTLCLSSQVGCKFGCSFCASAPFGFVRNLKASEILDEVLFIKAHNKDRTITNIVFMGIGEPLDNYNNVIRAIRILNDEDAFKIGARKITISTCGIIPGMEKLAGEKLQIELSVSLHSADDKIRSKLVPINKRYPLSDLMTACKDYTRQTKRIITFEYILIKGINASEGDAFKLARLLTGLLCKVNVISYNQIRAKGYEPPAIDGVKNFIRTLKSRGINAMLRKSKGEDIDAGCGQLRISRL
ncbi:MAG: 23S rRNA (adenine(2503)-C(2))-methyltransferase RlmN [Candidatus Omnitrophota bacterium]|nr:23S rRNA (adenine(2503)-C(2))-methyltransferase RlmN [Candidatus Omnitrophota bacterium]